MSRSGPRPARRPALPASVEPRARRAAGTGHNASHGELLLRRLHALAHRPGPGRLQARAAADDPGRGGPRCRAAAGHGASTVRRPGPGRVADPRARRVVLRGDPAVGAGHALGAGDHGGRGGCSLPAGCPVGAAPARSARADRGGRGAVPAATVPSRRAAHQLRDSESAAAAPLGDGAGAAGASARVGQPRLCPARPAAGAAPAAGRPRAARGGAARHPLHGALHPDRQSRTRPHGHRGPGHRRGRSGAGGSGRRRGPPTGAHGSCCRGADAAHRRPWDSPNGAPGSLSR